MAFNWLYTSWNDNEYILFLIIVILFFIIVDFKLIQRKRSNFFNLTTTQPNTALPTSTLPTTTQPNTTLPTTTSSSTTISNTTLPNTTQPNTTLPNTSTTMYQAPTATNPANNLFVSPEEKEKWRRAWVQLDGNEESLSQSSNVVISNDIIQLDSTLYGNNTSNTAANSVVPVNYSEIANWATIDDLGKSITDTLGGIKSNLGYTLLDEQLGTFTPPKTYDNTQNYKTGMNPSTVDGAQLKGSGTGYQQVGKSPIFMQKDFAGVANIFAPNIYVSNAPLGDDGLPNISFTNGDGNVYSV